MAYEMLTGHPPFTGKSAQMVMASHANQVPEAVAKRRPDAPGPLAKLVMKCLEKAPAARPHTPPRSWRRSRTRDGTAPRPGWWCRTRWFAM